MIQGKKIPLCLYKAEVTKHMPQCQWLVTLGKGVQLLFVIRATV